MGVGDQDNEASESVDLSDPLDVYLANCLPTYGIDVLPILQAHVLGVMALPDHHRDPFDRIMIAQAHNDYYHPRPLRDALELGFASVEADVFLVDGESSSVAVGTTSKSPTPNQESLGSTEG